MPGGNRLKGREMLNVEGLVNKVLYMEEAERLCDSLAIIDHGKIVAHGFVAELKAQLGASLPLRVRSVSD